MVAVNDVRLDAIEKIGDQPRLRNRDGEIAAVEVLNRRRPQNVLGGVQGPLELRRDDPHLVAAAAEFLFVGAHRAGHAAHVRQVGVGEHHDSHGESPSAKAP